MEFKFSPLQCKASSLFSPIRDHVISPLKPNLIPFSPIKQPMQASARPLSRKRLFDVNTSQARGTLPQKRGRKPLHEKHTNLVQTVTESLLDHGFAAHRRRSETWSSVGVTARRLTSEVLNRPKVSDLPKSISESSIKRLFVAPHSSRHASVRYHGVIVAKIGVKANDVSKENKNSHFCRSSVNYALEMATCFEDEVSAWSVDDKNKLLVGGGPCVDRRMSFKSYFMRNDMVHYPDHNFSTGYKIIPSGYMQLLHRPSPKQHDKTPSQEPPLPGNQCQLPTSKYRHDKLGRLHFNYPRTGPLSIYLRGNKFHKASVYNHHEDLKQLIQRVNEKDGKYAAVIISDNGPDWKKHSLKVVQMIGRLWRDLNLDYLCIVAYSPGDSRFNMVEHSWAPLTMWLTGLQLKASLPGEEKTPQEQTKLTQQERETKEAIVLDTAIDDVHRCLEGRVYDSFPLNIVPVPCRSTQHTDEAKIEELTNASLLKIQRDDSLSSLAEEFQFLSRHSAQRSFQLEFVKCESSSCGHCSKRPIRAKKLITFLREFADGYNFTPKPSEQHPDHFMAWHEMAQRATAGTLQFADVDEGLESPLSGEQRRCKQGCKKVFQSAADMDRHDRLIHKFKKL